MEISGQQKLFIIKPPIISRRPGALALYIGVLDIENNVRTLSMCCTNGQASETEELCCSCGLFSAANARNVR
jgi:hypothetical protein